MADTNMNVFVNSCAGYVNTYILGPIVQHLTGRGVATSVDELAGVLQLPVARSPVTPTPAIPAMAFGGAVPAMAPAVAPTSRKSTATTQVAPGRTCMYQFKRGENKGKYCGKGTAPGCEFCNSCLKTRKNITKEMAAGAAPGAAPAMGAIPGMAGLPPGYAAPVPAAPTQPGQLSVVAYDESKGWFEEPTHNFIVYQVSPGVIAALGRLNTTRDKIVPLTLQEQEVAQSIGLVLSENNTPAAAPAVPAIPAVVPPVPAAVPAIPTAVPAVPTIVPNIPQAGLAPTGAPALPVIAPLIGVAPAASPVATGVPQIPGIPQINM